MQADGAQEMSIRPFPGTVGTPNDAKYVITSVEPAALNRISIGRNIATEPSRREAARGARDSSQPRMTRRLAGARDMQRRSDHLVYVPLYGKGAPVETEAERRAAHVGWVDAQFFTDNFLNGVLGPMGEPMTLYFVEDGGLSRAHLRYASGATGGAAAANAAAGVVAAGALLRFERVTALDMAGQRFQLGWQ